MKIPHKYIILVILAGFLLRVWGLNYGLPFLLHQDEPIVVNHAAAYGTGDLNPHFFILPPLCSYILAFFYGIFYFLGKIFGLFAGTHDFAAMFFSDPTVFYIIARVILGLFPGVLIIWLVFFLYKRLFGEEGAIYASLIAAFSYLLVSNSHYAYVDNLMVFFVLLEYVFLIRMIEDPTLKNYMVPAVILALAVSTKYNGAILAFTFYVSHVISVFLHGKSKKNIILNRKLWISAALAIAVFIITNPFSALDWRFFLESVPGKIRKDYMGWTHHIFYSALEGIGLPLVLLSLAGVITIARRENKWKTIFFMSFPVIFYLHLVFASQRFSRYVLPLIPFMAIAASFFLFRFLRVKSGNNFQKTMIFLISLLSLLPTLAKSVKGDLLFSGTDTRIVSAEWIKENLAPYTKIAMDHTSFRPKVNQTKEQILEKFAIAGNQEGLGQVKEEKIKYMVEAIKNEKTYNIYFLTYKDELRGQFLSTVPPVPYDIEKLKEIGINLVSINYNTFLDEKVSFINELEKKAEILVAFSPYYDGQIRRRYDRVDTTAIPVGTKELFSRYMTGPVIVIYKLK